MEELLETYRNDILFAVLVGAFLISIIWEEFQPRRRVESEPPSRWAQNIGLTLINHLFGNWINAAVAVAVAWWVSHQGYGLLTQLDVGLPAATVTTLLVLALLSYIEHRLLHAVPWLWRLHAVHHSDTEFDFSLTYRMHPLEMVFVSILSMPVILLLGPPVAAVVLYQMARVSVNVFAHSNIYIPEKIEKWLRYFVVTPDFHRLHHTNDKKFTDSNFGTLLPWFDYLFGTATRKPFDEHPHLVIGLEYFREPQDSRIFHLLLMPFRWRHDEAGKHGESQTSV